VELFSLGDSIANCVKLLITSGQPLQQNKIEIFNDIEF
jgi:hypothetical protein